MKSTILARDGLVVTINAPIEEGRKYSRVNDETHFLNQKGCFGIICEAFCDAYGVFKMFEVKVAELCERHIGIQTKLFVQRPHSGWLSRLLQYDIHRYT